MIARTLLRHMLPVGLTTFCIFMLWTLVTLPMTAVFVLDDAFVLTDYVNFLAYAFVVAFGISMVILLPLALLGEVLTKRNKHIAWFFPGFLCLCAVTILVIRIIALKSFLGAVLSWSGFVLLISGLFILYWVVLWGERVVLVYWWKFRKSSN